MPAQITLRVRVEDGRKVFFSYSTDDSVYRKLEPSGIDGHYLPPWDRALRVGIVARGSEKSYGIFDSFVLRNSVME